MMWLFCLLMCGQLCFVHWPVTGHDWIWCDVAVSCRCRLRHVLNRSVEMSYHCSSSADIICGHSDRGQVVCLWRNVSRHWYWSSCRSWWGDEWRGSQSAHIVSSGRVSRCQRHVVQCRHWYWHWRCQQYLYTDIVARRVNGRWSTHDCRWPNNVVHIGSQSATGCVTSGSQWEASGCRRFADVCKTSLCRASI